MKKIFVYGSGGSSISLLKKNLLKMKLTFLCLLLSLVQLMANDGFSQSTRITLNLKDTRVEEVLMKIEEQSDFYFIYNRDAVDVNRKVDVSYTDKKISDILTGLFSGTDVSFEIQDRHIILKSSNSPSQQQKQTVSGKVTDSSGAPLPGVTVVVKGTTQGIITDADGKYSLANISSDGTLVFSFVGMRTQEIEVAGKTVIDMVMQEETVGIEEVVAVGYGTMKKSDLTGSIATVQSENLARMAPTKTLEALRGNVAGLNVIQSNGKVGSDFTMTIRGMSSIDKDNTPLVVIDGAIGGDINMLNPSDIESLDVLKDASATAIYGSKGANGVIIVTTKRGQKGVVKVTYDGNIGLSTPVNTPKYMSAEQHEALLASLPEVGLSEIVRTDEEMENVNNKRYFDWFKAVQQNGLRTNHTIALSGGGTDSKYYFSVGYSKNEGNIKPEEYDKVNLKAGIDSKISDKLSAGFSSYYTYSVRNEGSPEVMRTTFRMRWTIWPWDEDGNLTMTPSGVSGYGNPLIEIQNKNYSVEYRKQDFLGNVYLEYRPVKALSFRSSFSAISNNYREGWWAGPYTKSSKMVDSKVMASYLPRQTASYTWDNILTYDWSKNSHKLKLTAVNSLSYERSEKMYFQATGFSYTCYWYALENASSIESYSSDYYDWSLASFMGRANYSFKDKYLLTVTGRWDGSSKLADGHKWDFFPSAAFAWRASDEPFIKDMNTFSNLKLRFSYGEVGNDSVDPYSTQALVTASTYNFGSDQTGSAPASLANNNLGWEHSREFDLGIEAGFLNNKVMLTADLYNRKTKGLILNRAVGMDSGFNSITGNFGSTRNRGIELTLNTVNLSTKNFSWETNFNFAKNKNKILSLAENGMTKMEGSECIWRSYYREYIVGQDISSHYYYEFDGIFQEGEETSKLAQSMYGTAAQAGWVKVKDQNGDGLITADDKKVLGTESPAWTAGMTNTFRYKNVDFSFFFYTIQKVFSYDATWGTLGRADSYSEKRLAFINYWTPSNPSNTWCSVTQSDSNQYTGVLYLHNNSWIRLQNVTLGYTFPKSILDRIGINKIRLYATATNPLLISDYKGKGFDPEWRTQSSAGVGFSAASYIFGVNVTF